MTHHYIGLISPRKRDFHLRKRYFVEIDIQYLIICFAGISCSIFFDIFGCVSKNLRTIFLFQNFFGLVDRYFWISSHFISSDYILFPQFFLEDIQNLPSSVWNSNCLQYVFFYGFGDSLYFFRCFSAPLLIFIWLFVFQIFFVISSVFHG